MAEPSEDTPFLAQNNHENQDEHGYDYVKPLPANSYFKLPIRTLTAAICLLSLGVGIVCIAAIIFARTGPFVQRYHVVEEARDLAICVSISFKCPSFMSNRFPLADKPLLSHS
jgi:hypothetical protein